MHRFLLDNDGSNFFCHTMTDDVEGSVAEAVRECPRNVTTYLLCAGGGTHYFPTQVSRVVPTAERLLAAHGRGIDPFGLFLAALREAGKETFITLRMNDVHNPDDPCGWNTPRLKLTHPEYVVDAEAVREKHGGWMAHCLDYSRAEVREYFLALIRELAERYDFDGLQLDWMRFPRHLPGGPAEVWEKRDAITEFTRAVRGLLDAARRGRRRLLAVRVPTSLGGCRFVGLDVAAWAREGLVDFLVASPFLTTDFTMPLAEMRAALGAHPPPIYAAMDLSHGGQIHCPESMRAAAAGLFSCGANGIYLFNFPCWTERLAARPYHWLQGLDEPGGVVQKPLLFSVSHRQYRLADVDLPWQLPAPLPAGGRLDLRLTLPRVVFPIWRAIISVHSSGDIAIAVNGVPAVLHPALRRAEIFLEYTSQVPERAKRRPPDEECRVFYTDPAAWRAGENNLVLTNAGSKELQIGRLNVGLW